MLQQEGCHATSYGLLRRLEGSQSLQVAEPSITTHRHSLSPNGKSDLGRTPLRENAKARASCVYVAGEQHHRQPHCTMACAPCHTQPKTHGHLQTRLHCCWCTGWATVLLDGVLAALTTVCKGMGAVNPTSLHRPRRDAALGPTVAGRPPEAHNGPRHRENSPQAQPDTPCGGKLSVSPTHRLNTPAPPIPKTPAAQTDSSILNASLKPYMLDMTLLLMQVLSAIAACCSTHACSFAT